MRLARVYNSLVRNGFKYLYTVWAKNLGEESVVISPFGITSRPVTTQAEIGVVADTNNNSDPILLGLVARDIVPDLEDGETALYSVDVFGELSGIIRLKRDGSIVMGGASQTQKIGDASSQVAIAGETDNMVRYSELEKAFNELKKDFNDLVVAFNSHVHATAATGPPVPPTSVPEVIPASTSDANIEPSKIGNVTTNSTQ